MATMNILFMVLVLFMFNVRPALSQYQLMTPLVKVQTLSSGSVNVCGDSIVFTLNITNTASTSDSVASNIYVQVQMKPGLEYESGSVSGADYVTGFTSQPFYSDRTSHPNTPIFRLTGRTLASLASTTITFRARANCTLIPFLESLSMPQPVGITNTTDVIFTMKSAGFYNSESYGSESYNVGYAALQTLLDTGDKNITAARGDALVRTVKLLNTGVGYVKDSLLGGNGVTMKIRYPSAISVTKVCLGSSTTPLPHTSSGDTLIFHIADFSSIGDLDHYFEIGDTLLLKEYISPNTCGLSITTDYKAEWGCDSRICNAGDNNALNAAFINVAGIPAVVASVIQIPTTDLCGTNVKGIFKFTNNGNGNSPVRADGAYGFGLLVDNFNSYGSGDGGKIENAAIKDSTGGYTYLTALGASSGDYSLDNLSGLYHVDIDGAGVGLADLDGDGYYDDLPPGKDVTFRLDNNYTCPGNDYLRDLRVYSQQTSSCGNYSQSNILEYESGLQVGSSSVSGSTDVVGASTSPVVAGTIGIFNLSIGSTRENSDGLESCGTNTFTSYIHLPAGYSVLSLTWNGSPVSYTPSGDSIIVSGGGFSGSYELQVGLTCYLHVPETSSLDWKMFYQCGSCTTCKQWLVNTQSYTWYNHCSSCPGFHTTGVDVQRTTLGKVKPGAGYYTWGDYKAAAKVTSSTTGIRLDAGFQYDSLRVLAYGRIADTSASFDNAHVKLTYTYGPSGDPLTYLGASLIINGGSACALTGTPSYSSGSGTYTYDFDLTPCLGGMPIDSHDRFELIPKFSINSTSALSRGEYPLNIRAEYYGYDSLDGRNACESFGTQFTVLQPQIFSSSISGSDACGDQINIWSTVFRYAPSDSRETFPNEFRLLTHIEAMTTDVPAGFHYMTGNSFGLGGYFAFPGINDPTITTVSGHQHLSYPMSDDRIITDFFNSSFLAEAVLFKIAPDCDTTHLPTPVEHTDFTYTIGDYTYNSSYTSHISATNYTFLSSNLRVPNLSLSADAIQEAYSRTVTWPVVISNTADFRTSANSTNTWLKFAPHLANITLVSAKDGSGTPYTVTTLGGDTALVQVGTVALNGSKTIYLTATYSTCADNTVDSLTISAGFSCSGYPSSTSDYSCQTLLSKKLYIRYKLSILQPSIIRKTISYDLCEPIPFDVNLVSAGADMTDLMLWIKPPAGITLDVSGGYYTFPSTGTGLTAIGTNASAQGSGFTAGLGWNLSSALPSILDPFKGALYPGANSVKIRFDVSASCEYDFGKWGEPIRFFSRATASCGDSIILPFNQYRIKISGVDLDSLVLSATGASFTQCGAPVPITLTATNKGTTVSHDGNWEVTLPSRILYVPSSGIPAPLTTTVNADSSITYTWLMSGGIAVNASTSFTFYAAVAGFSGTTGLKIIARTRIPASAMCASTGVICKRYVTTGLDSIPASISLTAPGLAIGPLTDSLCAGTVQHFTATSLAGYNTYNWFVNGMPEGNQPGLDYTIIAGANHVRLTASQSGLCALTDSLLVTGLVVPDILVVDTVSATSCAGSADGTVTFHLLTSDVTVSTIQLTGPGLSSGKNIPLTDTFEDSLQAGFFQFVITYANGCIRTSSFTVPQGGPSVNACVENIGCNTEVSQSSALHFTFTRVYPHPTGTYHYQVLKNNVSYLSGTGVFGTARTESLSSVTTSDVFKVQLVPDTDVNGNVCTLSSDPLAITIPNLSLSGPATVTPCVQGHTVSFPVVVNPGLNACTVDTSTYNFRLYKYDSTSSAYVVLSGPFTQDSTTHIFSGLGTGFYRVKVTLDEGGHFDCSATLDFQVVPSHNIFTVTPHQQNLICHGGRDGSASVDVNGGTLPITYRWYNAGSPGDTLSTSYAATGLSAGTYTVVIRDENACQDTSTTHTFTLTEPPALDPVNVEAIGVCALKASSAGGGTPFASPHYYTFTWIYYNPQVIKTLDSLGNVLTDTQYVRQTLWIDRAPSTSGGSYTSDPSTYPPFVVKTGAYKVILSDANGCQVTDSLYLNKPTVPRTYALCMRYTTLPSFKEDTTHIKIPTLVDFFPVEFSNQMDAQVNQCKTEVATEATGKFAAQCNDVNKIKDKLIIDYGIHYFQYTLYYYDRAGRLARTVPPKGVNPTYTDRTPTALKHTFVSSYNYNSYGQLIDQATPDADTSHFIYNETGQLRFSQNARQKVDGTYSYSKYDSLGRVKEVGESTLAGSFDALNDTLSGEMARATNVRYPRSNSTLNHEQTFTEYSDSVPGASYYGMQDQQYLQNRVSHSYTINKQGSRVDEYYSYDPHGNVRWLMTDVPGFGKNHVFYEYDLISNKVLRVKFNEFRKDRYFHRYNYDEDNRITLTETSKDSILWEADANYKYYAHGPLRRAGMGEDQIQGVDYVYTLHGWLKGINSPNLIATEDPGHDSTIANSGYAPDAFGMTLGYYENDFTRTGIFNSTTSGKYYLSNAGKNLYNGNISQWQSKSKDAGMLSPTYFNGRLTGELYTYDRLNRIKSSSLNPYSGGFTTTADYGTTYSYDPNGNITTLQRKAYSGIQMDDLQYHYNTTDNKLQYVSDVTGASQDGTLGDIKAGQSSGNYVYDASGRLTRDVQSKLTFVWTVSDKLSLVIPDKVSSGLQPPSLKFIYDPMGNRIGKEVNTAPYYSGTTFKDTITDLTKIKTTYYVRDASGNVMSIYERTNAYSRDTSYYPCAKDPIDSAVYKGIKYCFAGSIPTYNIVDTSITIMNDTLNTINSGDTLILGDTTTYAGNFTLNSGGLLIIKGNYTPSYYTFNSGGRIIVAPGGSLTFPYIYLGTSQTIDNYGTLSLTNPGIAGTINNYGVLNTAGNLSGGSGGTLINYGTLNATGGMEGNASVFTNYGSVNVTGNFSNNGGTVLNEGPVAVSGHFANNTGTVTNKCTITIDEYLEIDANFYNFGKITSDSTSTINGGGTLFLEGGSTLETKQLTVYHVIQNDSTGCSLLRVTGHTLTEGGGATYNGNVTLCGVVRGTVSAADWNSGTVYTSGQKAVYGGILYEAKWWTEGDEPDTHSGPYDVWINEGTYIPPVEGDTSTCDCTPGKVVCALVTKHLYTATIKQVEVPLYGSDRLGEYKPDLTVDTIAFFSDSLYAVHIEKSTRSYLFNDTTTEQTRYRVVGDKQYELKDHLSNVRALVSDVKSPLVGSGVITGAEADVVAYYNYYAFGMSQPLRTYNASDYRYGFNGMEKDDEVKGSGNSYDFGARIYDPRLGRFFTTDPNQKQSPDQSPYAAFNGNPILYIDPTGKSGEVSVDKAAKTVTVTSHIIFYGEGSSPELAKQSASDIQNAWNSACGTVMIDGEEYSVTFSVTAEHRESTMGRVDPISGETIVNSLENEISPNTDIKNNYVKVVKSGIDVSYMDGLGSNTGVWLLNNIQKENSTTEPHEMGHGWGAVKDTEDSHPAESNIKGKGQPGIMHARGTIVDPQYQWNPNAKAGQAGGTLNPDKRKVTQQDINYLDLNKVQLDENGKGELGKLTNKTH
ncbi:MAG: conserved repeat domain protein [Chitinophagaceae bacterium]|nr:conserved repeat domain protein [Chitinophagaceae bacterium]